MSLARAEDPYRLDPSAVQEPPRSFGRALLRIGPGMIVAAAVVGSGELIATTMLGAKVGFAALWVVVLSCLIKPVIQAELGRYTIATGAPSLESFNELPGPRFKVGWVVWAWAFMVLATLLQVGAMFGGVAQVLNLVVPAIPTRAWILILLGLTLALLLGGGYSRIERLAMVKVGVFTMLTVLAAVLALRRPEFSWAALLEGFRLRLPGDGVATAVAVFGMTGVGTIELFIYPYWCVEKGYARYAGPADGSAAWLGRAAGWVKVMHLDIIVSMGIYTLATVAFYVLGASVLHGAGLVPAAGDMIQVLSRIYTDTLGPWALWVFYAGAIVTLYGTIFAGVASHSRMYTDMLRLIGRFDRSDHEARQKYRKLFVVLLTVLPVSLYLAFESPIMMIVFGGMAQSLMLPVVALGTLFLRHRRLPRELRSSTAQTIGLWVASAVIIVFIVYYLAEAVAKR